MSITAIDAAQELSGLEDEVSVDRLDYIHDLQKLLGVVIGTQALLRVALNGTSERSRVSAAKALAKVKEDPEEIAKRLRSAPFADLSMEELEAIVQTGEVDPEKAMEELEG